MTEPVWRMSAAELDALWDIVGLGERPYPLELPSPGVTHAERDALLAETWRDLAGRGFAHGHRAEDQVDDRLAAAMRAAATGVPAIEAQIAADRHMRARAAVTGRTAGMVLQTEDTARVDLLTATGWPAAIVALLPPLPAMAGQSITVPARAWRSGLAAYAAGSGQGAFEDELRDAGVGAVQARWLARLASATELIGVQLTVYTTRRRPETLSWYGTPDGAAMLLGIADDAEWVSVVPAGRDQLGARLAEAAEL